MSWLDLTEVKDNGFELLPEGSYLLVADEAVVKQTKSGTGEYVSVSFKVVGGQYAGRTLFHMFNIKNDNAKAVEIGLAQLKTFLKCAGKQNAVLTSVTDLLGLKSGALVKVRVDAQYGDKNVISYFKPMAEEEDIVYPKATTPF